MPAIRCRYNGGCYVLYPAIKTGRIPLCGQTVQVVEAEGYIREPFLGFTSISALYFGSGAIITGVDAYTHGNDILGPWTEFTQRSWLLAHKTDQGIYLVINDDLPVIVGASDIYSKDSRPQNKNNVARIGTGTKRLMKS